MLPVAEAETLILNACHQLGSEWIDFTQARGRILAETITSPHDFPAHATSSMDGYAVRSQDCLNVPVNLDVIETVPAGSVPTQTLQPGQATRLFTGSILPPGSNAVVMQEQTERVSETCVRVEQSVPMGHFVRPQGDYCRQGDPLMPIGLHLGGAEIAVLAAIQRVMIQVSRQPRVAILSTGNELVRVDQAPAPGQIVDSNQYALAALVTAAGGIPIRFGVIPDQPERLQSQMQQALATADVVLSTGGVSVGDYDFVETLLQDLGGDILIHRVAIKPGRPLTFATFGSTLYFGLPGNPVSAMVTFWRFVQPALLKRQGSLDYFPRFLTAMTKESLRADGKRDTYLWGHLDWTHPQLHFQPMLNHNSGNLINLAGCDGLAILPIGCTEVVAGTEVKVLLIPR